MKTNMTTEAATGVTFSDAVLNGWANPNDFATTIWFEYGTSTNYGQATVPVTLGAGTNEVPIQAAIQGLAPATTYHVRLSGTNNAGAGYGEDRVFVTPAFSTFSDMGMTLPNGPCISLNWGDFNSDGQMDLVVDDTVEKNFRTHWLRNDGESFTELSALSSFSLAFQTRWGDFNRDNVADFFVGTTVFQNQLNGTFAALPQPLTNANGGGVVWGDYTGDGALDAVVYFQNNAYAYPNAVLFTNQGNGKFAAESYSPFVLSDVAPALVDYDNDGRLDLFMGFPSWIMDPSQRLLHNVGNGSFSTNGPSFYLSKGRAMNWGDFDNDGYLDALTMGLFGTFIYRNQGDGTFVNIATNLPDGSSYACGDYDNDGLLDFAILGSGWSEAPVYHNDGGGAFSDGGFSVPGASSFAWADYNNDGSLDFAVSGETTNAIKFLKIFRNNVPRKNSPPDIPTGLTSTVAGNGVVLSWNRATDANQTNGFSYNLRLGRSPGGKEVMSPLADLHTGLRRVVGRGNAGLGLKWELTNLPPGVYYWSVQAIDHSFAGSPFATEQVFVVGSTPVILRNENFGIKGGRFGFDVAGPTGRLAVVEMSSNLINWVPVWSNTLGSEAMYFSDTSEVYSNRYYRVRLP